MKKNSLLLVVDVQNDFCPNGALAVRGGDEIVPLVNKLAREHEHVVLTQDWHPADHKSFASSHPGKKIFDEIQLEGLTQILWPDHCVQQSFGAEFSSQLDAKKIEAIFRKGMDKEIDSYSGFFDNGKKKATGLAPYLAGRNVSSVFVAGLAADYCVFFTAMDALELDFGASIIKDATMAIDNKSLQEKFDSFVSKGGALVNSQDI